MRRMTIALAITTAVLAGCGGGSGSRQERTVTIKGSDTMVILGQRWAEQYMTAHPGAVIQVNTAWDYVEAQAHTLGDFQGEGECPTREILD